MHSRVFGELGVLHRQVLMYVLRTLSFQEDLVSQSFRCISEANDDMAAVLWLKLQI